MGVTKPCPFCGELDLHRIEFTPEIADEIPPSYVHCNNCGASGPQHREDDLQGWEAWNTRAGERLQ